MKPLTMSDRELTWLRDAFPRTTSNGGLLLAEVDAAHAEIARLRVVETAARAWARTWAPVAEDMAILVDDIEGDERDELAAHQDAANALSAALEAK